MTNPYPLVMVTTMMMILLLNLMTTKTSLMCLNMIVYIFMAANFLSMKLKLTPIPFIIFLTMIGGLMIIFLYLAATLWMKKEKLTLKTKFTMMMIVTLPLIYPMNFTALIKNKMMSSPFKNNLNTTIILLIILLTLMLAFAIEIHMKMCSFFRRKLKIW